MIVSITGATTYYILNRYYVNDISGLIAPTILTMIIAYSVASAFGHVFEAVAATMIQCFITGTVDTDTKTFYYYYYYYYYYYIFLNIIISK